jgi:hypothetical protein
MELIHYWGSREIARRMGWKSTKPLRRHIKALAFPAYKRRDPRNPLRVLYYSHEALIQRPDSALGMADGAGQARAHAGSRGGASRAAAGAGVLSFY